MKNRIFRTKQEEYWDIWCENAIVFPETKTIEEVFTEDNLRKLQHRPIVHQLHQ